MVRRPSVKGKGAELFFGGERPEEIETPPPAEISLENPSAHAEQAVEPPAQPSDNGVGARTRSRRTPKTKAEIELASPNASELASLLACYEPETIEDIRKAVKLRGREVSFIRLTEEEKNRLADIIYTYKRQGIKTTENEISRVAINFLMNDYQTNGANSVLARVLAALQA